MAVIARTEVDLAALAVVRTAFVQALNFHTPFFEELCAFADSVISDWTRGEVDLSDPLQRRLYDEAVEATRTHDANSPPLSSSVESRAHAAARNRFNRQRIRGWLNVRGLGADWMEYWAARTAYLIVAYRRREAEFKPLSTTEIVEHVRRAIGPYVLIEHEAGEAGHRATRHLPALFATLVDGSSDFSEYLKVPEVVAAIEGDNLDRRLLPKNARQHAEWLVKHVVLGRTASEIAEEDPDNLNVSTINKGIVEFAKRVVLTLPRVQGRRL